MQATAVILIYGLIVLVCAAMEKLTRPKR